MIAAKSARLERNGLIRFYIKIDDSSTDDSSVMTHRTIKSVRNGVDQHRSRSIGTKKIQLITFNHRQDSVATGKTVTSLLNKIECRHQLLMQIRHIFQTPPPPLHPLINKKETWHHQHIHHSSRKVLYYLIYILIRTIGHIYRLIVRKFYVLLRNWYNFIICSETALNPDNKVKK